MSCGRHFLVFANVYVSCVTSFGVAITGKPALTIDCISHPHLRNPKIRYDIGFSVGAFTKINICFVTPFWGCSQG